MLYTCLKSSRSSAAFESNILEGLIPRIHCIQEVLKTKAIEVHSSVLIYSTCLNLIDWMTEKYWPLTNSTDGVPNQIIVPIMLSDFMRKR